MAQEHGTATIEFFRAVRDNPEQPIQARLYAGNELLNRGFGRPSQDVAVQMQQAQDTPEYFAWLTPDRLRLISGWLQEARASMERGDLPPGRRAAAPRLLLPPVEGEVMDETRLGSVPQAAQPTGET